MRSERVSVVLKEGACAWAAGRDGGLIEGDHGLYAHDARWLRRFAWRWPDDLIELRLDHRGPTRVRQRLARIEGVDALGQRSPREALAVRRELRIRADGVEESLTFEAWRDGPVAVNGMLSIGVDVQDVFEVRGFAQLAPRSRRTPAATPLRREVVVEAPDGVIDRVVLDVDAGDGLAVQLGDEGVELTGNLPAGATSTLRIRVTVERRRPSEAAATAAAARLRDLDPAPPPPLPAPSDWRDLVVPTERRSVLAPEDDAIALAAADDLRALLLPTPYGSVPAAGVPWYVAPFGRDALLTCLMVPEAEGATRATLRLLARLQGRTVDPARAETPGKIPHEMRVGAVTRTGALPFGPHYGTVDATPLWIVALARRVRAGDEGLLDEIAPALFGAIDALRAASDPDDGLLRFVSGEGGYQVQSWKDAGDSMTYGDGRLARGRLAVVEVQGYAEAAWRDAAELLEALGRNESAQDARRRGERVRSALAQRFFLPQLGRSGCHALALDEHGDPLDVVSSDPGHLLWTGSLSPDQATAVASTLLDPTVFSGWGLRTLAANERRYASVSYHCGSVWPHDTALFALGLERYGMRDAARRVGRALLDLSAARSDRRAPELIAGDVRDDGPPVDYPDACRLQAWSAAATIAMHALLVRLGPRSEDEAASPLAPS